jgi:hypothetical protein
MKNRAKVQNLNSAMCLYKRLRHHPKMFKVDLILMPLLTTVIQDENILMRSELDAQD